MNRPASLPVAGPLTLAALIFVAALTRVIPHPPNFSPIEAVALFGGAYFAKRHWALLVPLAAMFLSDLVLGLLRRAAAQLHGHRRLHRLAADLAIGLTVAELSDDQRTLARMTEIGLELRDRHGADVLVMGCAGMARFRDDLAAQTGLPVVEPTLAATGMAMSRVLAG